jgi:hypothetical protein
MNCVGSSEDEDDGVTDVQKLGYANYGKFDLLVFGFRTGNLVVMFIDVFFPSRTRAGGTG